PFVRRRSQVKKQRSACGAARASSVGVPSQPFLSRREPSEQPRAEARRLGAKLRLRREEEEQNCRGRGEADGEQARERRGDERRGERACDDAEGPGSEGAQARSHTPAARARRG